MLSEKTIVLLLALFTRIYSQGYNRAPYFIPSVGDLSKFSLSEKTPVGTPVYQLKGADPENSTLTYTISGQHFSVDPNSGVVILQQPLDRESLDHIQVVISVTDAAIGLSEPNTVSLRREITILDENDNPPVFLNRPYTANISESSAIGTDVLTNKDILVSDKDEGINADITLSCFLEREMQNVDDVCETFGVSTEAVDDKIYKARITLLKPLNYEARAAYLLTLKASDGSSRPLSAFATVAINIVDVQDQPPIFSNAPYSSIVPENTPEGTSIMTIRAKDGDKGHPRPVLLTLENDTKGYFRLEPVGNNSGESLLVTSNVPLDREDSEIMQNGGIYAFSIKATELLNNEIPVDYSVSPVTIVVTDVDDHVPQFNEDSFDVFVAENIETDTPLPGLFITIDDNDLGTNAQYNLSLVNVQNSNGVFSVSPNWGQGRTPVVVKVMDTSRLDYDIMEEEDRTFIFELVATVHNKDVSKTRVTVHVVDVNDHSPEFSKSGYNLRVVENEEIGKSIASITATDKDQGDFATLTYSLQGFGAENFMTDAKTGGIKIAKKIDYETHKSFSFTLKGKDGGGRIATTNIHVEVEDVNDNAPVFEHSEYHRIIRDGATSFEPQLFIRATDIDGKQQGGGKVTYSIESKNSLSDDDHEDIFSIESVTGEMKINRPVNLLDTLKGQYELVVKATDAGFPPLSNTTKIFIRVGIPGNQRPIFRDVYNKALYTAVVPEDAKPGTVVIKVEANDPDGQDSLLKYFLSGGDKENFNINEKTGVITVSYESHLDLDYGLDHYDLIINAVDQGTPMPETATTIVHVRIRDVNNKSPKFKLQNSTAYVSEQAKVGDQVIQVKAIDPDMDSNITYSITEPIKALDKTGISVTSTDAYNYKNAFAINQNGIITVNHTLNHNSAAVIMLTIIAKDINATDEQIAKTDVTIYVQPYSDNNPVFSNSEWTHAHPVISLDVDEEKPIGTTILYLEAKDPVTQAPINNFVMVHSESDVFTLVRNGEIILTKRLDYDVLDNKNIVLNVQAISNDGRTSNAKIIVRVMNINDNSPIFKEANYKVQVEESVKRNVTILTVKATDDDNSADDSTSGFGDIRYSLLGEGSNYFTINDKNGEIKLSPNVSLDREKQSVIKFNVVASDTPSGGPTARKGITSVTIEVLDVNDNAPEFKATKRFVVVPENAPMQTSVINVTAIDPDEGIGGDIRYEIVDEVDALGLFQINHNTGEIKTKILLTGKGRKEPYTLVLRAEDGGGLSSDFTLTIYIADVSVNDGIPVFIKPTVDQVAYISENASIGSPVFQALAIDPDDPNTSSGILTYKILKDGIDHESFNIDPSTGLLTTRKLLDREKKEKHVLVLVAQDRGDPPQQTSRVLTVYVNDVDDHKPRFLRGVNDLPLQFSVEEEIKVGSKVAEIKAIDEDIDENGAIDYAITDSNGYFTIERTENNTAIIRSSSRLDRENVSQYLLTIKCFKASNPPIRHIKTFNRMDPSQIQVVIKLIDIDDNLPIFTKDNITLGVRLNVPVDTSLTHIEATDLDSSAGAMQYNISNITFTPLFEVNEKQNISNVFRLDQSTGELRTAKSLLSFVDGVFTLIVVARNSNVTNRESNITIKIHIVRDSDLLKFVFNKPPTEVRQRLPTFEREIKEALNTPELSIHIYDTQFHAKQDNSLDFSATSSCFQLVGDKVFTTKEMLEILQDPSKQPVMNDVFNKYQVANVEPCSLNRLTKTETSGIQIWVLLIAALIGFAAFISSIIICCLHGKYKQNIKELQTQESFHTMSYQSISASRIYNEPSYSS